jgi:hypothetical protein
LRVERRASWRLTFAAWSTLFVVWAIATFALQYDILGVVAKFAGNHGGGATAAVGLVIGLPLLVDATRNVQRGYRLWRRRALQIPAGASWSEQVPASTPRQYRGGGIKELTRRERAIVEQGQLAYGRVEHHGELMSVSYQAPWGDAISSRPIAVADPPREGARAPLLLEQGARVGVAPTLLGLEFLAAEPEDRRGALQPPQIAAHPPPTPLSVALHASLHPVERTSGSRASQVGELSYDGTRLTLAHPAAHPALEPLSLRLDRPLRVQLSTFLLPGAVAELNVCMEPQTSSAYRTGKQQPLRFKTELPQRRIGTRVERAWVDACYLAPRDFDVLWELIVASAGDAALTSSVSP